MSTPSPTSPKNVIHPTLNEIKMLMIEHFDHRINLNKEIQGLYWQENRAQMTELRSEILRWCRERFGIGALGIAVNRDDPGFYRFQTGFVDPDVGRFAYDPDAAWISRGWIFRFKEETAAFEFKMRWKGLRFSPG